MADHFRNLSKVLAFLKAGENVKTVDVHEQRTWIVDTLFQATTDLMIMSLINPANDKFKAARRELATVIHIIHPDSRDNLELTAMQEFTYGRISAYIEYLLYPMPSIEQLAEARKRLSEQDSPNTEINPRGR